MSVDWRTQDDAVRDALRERAATLVNRQLSAEVARQGAVDDSRALLLLVASLGLGFGLSSRGSGAARTKGRR